MNELRDMFQDMAALLEMQGENLNSIEKNMDNGLFVRVEGNVTAYQDIKLQGTNTDAEDANANTIDITGMDGATATLSIGKSF